MMSTVSLPRRRLLLLQLLSLSFLLLALHTQCSALKHTIVGGPDATPLEDEVAPEPPSHQALRDANKRAMLKAAAVEARCDRRVARKARALVQTHVWDVVNAYGYALPPSCALHPERDMLLEQEHTKKVVRRGQWQCEACGRHFVSEEWIDLHMDRRHIEDFMLANPSRDVCLADYCPVFQCQDAGARSYSQAEYKHSQCDAAEMARLQRKCSALLLGCFPYEQVQGKGGMTSLVLDSVCGMLTCDEDVKAALHAKKLHFTGAAREWSVPYTVAAVVLVIVLLAFYVVMYSCGKLPGVGGVQHKSDFRRLRAGGANRGGSKAWCCGLCGGNKSGSKKD